jgi:hypothetical protein
VRGTDGDDHLDPDEQAQRVVRLLCDAFEQPGRLHGLLRSLVAHDIRLPIRPHQGGNRGQLAWHRPHRMTWQNVLHHPLYAGAYRWGYRKSDPRKQQPGRPNTGKTVHPPESCEVCIKERFPASLSWQRFEAMQQRWANHRSLAQAQGAPREGPSVLGGLLRGGRCGRRLAPSSSGKANHLRSTCLRATIADGAPGCLRWSGAFLDDGVVAQRMAVLQPASLALSIAAAHAVRAERGPLATHWQQRLERAHDGAERAARQYPAGEPENWLVGRALERQWEEALRHEQHEQEA